MGNCNYSNSKKKINLNYENCNNQKNKIFKYLIQNKKEDNDIIIELEIFNKEKEKEINILCDISTLIEDNKKYDDYYKRNNINPPKEFTYFNKDNTKLYLNKKEIEFNYKLKLNKIGINKIKIKSNLKLFSLSSMFYNCNNIININFIKINTNNVTNMRWMFYFCYNLSKLDLSLFNTKNVNNMSCMFAGCESLSELDLSSFNTNNVTDMSGMFSDCENISKLFYHHLILIR